MERYMLHLKNNGYLPKDAPTLLGNARYICADMGAVIRDMRVSTNYLEFDISIKKQKLDELIENMLQISELDHVKQVIEEKKDKDDAIKEGISYFNDERFWECHEVLEGVWKKCFEGEKDLVQGIILVAAAFVHYQKAQDEICFSILDRALTKLANSTGTYFNIDIESFKNKVAKITESGTITLFKI